MGCRSGAGWRGSREKIWSLEGVARYLAVYWAACLKFALRLAVLFRWAVGAARVVCVRSVDVRIWGRWPFFYARLARWSGSRGPLFCIVRCTVGIIVLKCMTSCGVLVASPCIPPPYGFPTPGRVYDVPDPFPGLMPFQRTVPQINPCLKLLIERGCAPGPGGAAGSRPGVVCSQRGSACSQPPDHRVVQRLCS